MAHGPTGTMNFGLARYAQRFAAAGFAVVVFDYRHFGASDGRPRQLIRIGRQVADWRAAVRFARTLPQVDPDWVALWGTSLSGGHVVTVAADDPSIAAVVAQLPFMGVDLHGSSPRTGRVTRKLFTAAILDAIRGVVGRAPLTVPMVAEPGAVAVCSRASRRPWRCCRRSSRSCSPCSSPSAQKHVLTRRSAVIETLGSATVVCVDKTGTLTMNSMTVRELIVGTWAYTLDENPLPEAFHTLAEFSVLASPVDPFDPDKAFKALGEKYLTGTEHLHAGWELIREYPLSKKLLALSHVWRSPDGRRYIVAAKGAPEAIADLCHFGPDELASPTAQVETATANGQRVLGVARAYFKQDQGRPTEQHDFDFEYLGLAGLHDPVRPGVAGRGGRMRTSRRTHGHDHRRLSRHRCGDRLRDRPGSRHRVHHRSGARDHG
jgi:hypothetical protein